MSEKASYGIWVGDNKYVLYLHSCHIVKKSFVCANHAVGLLVVCCPFAASNQTLLRVKVPAVRIKVCDNTISLTSSPVSTLKTKHGRGTRPPVQQVYRYYKIYCTQALTAIRRPAEYLSEQLQTFCGTIYGLFDTCHAGVLGIKSVCCKHIILY